MDRTWGGTSASGKIPDYLLSDPAYNGGIYVKPNNKGVIARIWEKPVMDRLIALHKALAARFDKEPYVEGIVLAETSPGFSESATWLQQADLGSRAQAPRDR